jgi:hypothetical protein
MKETLVQQCLNILKREDIKNEVKTLTKPLINIMLYEIKPYIYVVAILLSTILVLNLIMFIILISLLHNKQLISKYFKVVEII